MADDTNPTGSAPSTGKEKIKMDFSGDNGVIKKSAKGDLLTGETVKIKYKKHDASKRGDAAVTEFEEPLTHAEGIARRQKYTQDVKALEDKLKNLNETATQVERKEAETALQAAKEEAKSFNAAFQEAAHGNFKRLGFVNKIGARVAGKFGAAGWGERIVRGGFTGLGAVLVGKGIKDLVAPQRDESGNNLTGVGIPVLEVAGGLTGIYFAALHGGADRAMGLHVPTR